MRNKTFAAALFVASSSAFAQYTVVPSSVVVKAGDPAPSGRVGPDVFSSFLGVPAVNSQGNVAFASVIASVDGSAPSVATLWSNAAGPLAIAAIEGTPIAPTSTDPTRAWASLSSSTLYLADNGRLVASSLGSPAFPLGTLGRYALMANTPTGAWSFVAVNDQPLPGVPGQTYAAPLGSPAVRIDNGLVAFPARDTAFSWYYIKEDAAGGLTVVDQVPPPSVSGTPLSNSLASTGDFAYPGRYSGGVGGFVRGQVGARGPLLSLVGNTVTFLNAPGSWVIAASDISQPCVNGQGEFLVECKIRDAANAGAPQLGAALRFSPAGVVLLARQGDAVPGGGGLLWGDVSASVPVLSDTGQSAWWTKVSGPGTNATNDTVVALFGSGDSPTTKVLMRGGAPVAELPGYTVGNVLNAAMTPTGRTVINCAVYGPGGPSSAVFGVDHSGRTRLLAAAYATSIVMPSLGPVALTNLTQSNTSGGNDGATRQLTTEGRLVSSISYTGGKAVVFFSIPCPADIASTGGVSGYDGVMDNNDFIVYIDWFFNADARADRGAVGGVPGADGQFDNNDFVVFINEFFNGCE